MKTIDGSVRAADYARGEDGRRRLTRVAVKLLDSALLYVQLVCRPGNRTVNELAAQLEDCVPENFDSDEQFEKTPYGRRMEELAEACPGHPATVAWKEFLATPGSKKRALEMAFNVVRDFANM